MQIADIFKIKFLQLSGLFGKVHLLNNKINAFARGVSLRLAQNKLFAKDRNIALNIETRPLIVIGDERFADDDTFMGFQFNF